ncbi:hypothetical protein GCM10025868_23630 [Angustibacter aerolatus]|uniref:Uncharacterized protein n=1 Tax=Angustibacter aerolatus TaxID=1162965 RepID=A0ABQ6JG03_9ACTN|nr:hypothetical protein GCM10025868_23630 [Angustibacter aerolatus]
MAAHGLCDLPLATADLARLRALAPQADGSASVLVVSSRSGRVERRLEVTTWRGDDGRAHVLAERRDVVHVPAGEQPGVRRTWLPDAPPRRRVRLVDAVNPAAPPAPG